MAKMKMKTRSSEAVSLIVDLPKGMSPAQARKLSSALETFLVDFGRTTSGAGQRLKIRSVSGPASPVRLHIDDRSVTLPAVVLKQSAGR